MILTIKHDNSIIVKVYCSSNPKLLKTETKNNFVLDFYELQVQDNLVIEAYLINKNTFKIVPFKENWYDGIKSSILSVDCIFKKQKWKIDFVSKKNSRLEITINSNREKNILNGYIEWNSLKIENSKNIRIESIALIQKYTKEKFIIAMLMLVNLIPLIILIFAFLYVDIFHPEFFRSGMLYIFIADIPLVTVLIIYIVRYAIYLKNIESNFV